MTNGEKYKTAEERSKAYLKFCGEQKQCNMCKLQGDDTDCGSMVCEYKWLDLEYKEGLKHCPFCGGKAKSRKSNRVYYVFCTNCSVKTVDSITPDAAIAAWNMRVK